MELNINFLLHCSSLLEYIVVFELDSKQLCSSNGLMYSRKQHGIVCIMVKIISGELVKK